ncbi:MAG TPA: hypothetical protein VKI00_32340 [Mycobacterium sp.]|uniref:hypothetical protein n=1 Tax=Mycobacterium sp. TaxID=1785 RepID=UPI002C0945AA|nr:hypothetical protein [Mycobacterium sp.]HME80186.1 hypothetical protein [Mycobacterium sp.]
MSKRRTRCPHDLLRTAAEPPPAPPQITHVPGMAGQLLAELAPLLAEDGYHFDDDGVLDGPDLDDPTVFHAALRRAIERHNLQQSTPVGATRENACTTLQLALQAIAIGDTCSAGGLLDGVRPVAATPAGATVAACIGVGLGLLDDWLTARHPDTPNGLATRARLPDGHWLGERAATDILALARKHRAFDAQNQLIIAHGGRNVHYGTALALTGTLHAWARLTGQHIGDLAPLHIT